MIKPQINDRRERRIAARKIQILDAAARVFSHLGYERATTREIAEAADVSEGTLYNYFSNKQALLIGVAKRYADEIAADINRIEAEDFGEMLAQLMANRFRGGQERRLFMLFFLFYLFVISYPKFVCMGKYYIFIFIMKGYLFF